MNLYQRQAKAGAAMWTFSARLCLLYDSHFHKCGRDTNLIYLKLEFLLHCQFEQVILWPLTSDRGNIMLCVNLNHKDAILDEMRHRLRHLEILHFAQDDLGLMVWYCS